MKFNLIIIVCMLKVLINDRVLINTCSIKYFNYRKCLNNIFISNGYYVVLVIRILVYNKHRPAPNLIAGDLDKPP
jgi:hypothetical protein